MENKKQANYHASKARIAVTVGLILVFSNEEVEGLNGIRYKRKTPIYDAMVAAKSKDYPFFVSIARAMNRAQPNWVPVTVTRECNSWYENGLLVGTTDDWVKE